jgi:hypothetical protein
MTNSYIRCIFLIFMGMIAALPSHAQSNQPAIFYTDLQSGPNTGGEGNNGVIVSIFGKNFGSSQGSSTVTFGGGAVATYKHWCSTCDATGQYDVISVAIGPSAATGAVVVTVGGLASQCENRDDGCNFTVRNGNIYYVATTGSDSATGSFASPWVTPFHAMRSVVAGDTVYLENGVSTGGNCDGLGWHSALTVGTSVGVATGTSGNPIALVAYPGATATIGSLGGGSCSGDTTVYAIRASPTMAYFVVSGLTLRGPKTALSSGSNNWRVVNSDVSCGLVDGYYACVGVSSSNMYIYGNEIHDIGATQKLQHVIYVTTNTNHVWIGWNRLGDGVSTTCTSLMVHSTGGNNQFDIHIHDNVIHNDRCTGINLATVDPSQGPVEIYNNIIYHTGTGPQPSDSSFYQPSCIYAAGGNDTGPPGTGTVLIYDNTMYDCGGMLSGGVSASYGVVTLLNTRNENNLFYSFINNIFYPTVAEASYFGGGGNGTGTARVSTCSNNVFFQGGPAPSACTTNAVTLDPSLVSLTSPDFHLLGGSPTIGAGSASQMSTWDRDGNPRIIPSTIGAYELAGGIGRPNPPTNLSVIVR